MSQDPLKVTPHAYRVLFENERVRVLEARLKPGEKSAMHWHPANVVYFPTASKMKFTSPDGRSREVQIEAGEMIWREASSHAGENVGSTQFQALIVELKR